MAIAIAIKPIPGPADKPGIAAGGPPDGPDDTGAGQSIVDQCKALGEDDLTTLMHGISPEALEVMEQIPELSPFANWIEHGSTSEEPDNSAPMSAGPAKPMSARDSVAQAMSQNGMKGGY